MDWNNGNVRLPSFVSRPDNSFSFLYNYSYDQFTGLEMKQPSMQATPMLPTLPGKSNVSCLNIYGGQDPKKKRLSSEQLESLENSFQEEIKLDPDRKMKLAKELGLQPRQIAVWFQNRRARWKAKHLENMYDALKQDFDAIQREKQKLQQEVMSLRALLKDQVSKKQLSTDISGEETVDSTSIPSSEIPRAGNSNNNNNVHQIAECNYLMNVEDYNNPVMMTPYNWAALP